jgi:hypothetical protein
MHVFWQLPGDYFITSGVVTYRRCGLRLCEYASDQARSLLVLASLGGGVDMTQAVDRDYVLSSPTYQVKAQATLFVSGQLRGLAATL